jgi:inositol oxygenase
MTLRTYQDGSVKDYYTQMRQNQTVEYVQRMKNKYGNYELDKMTLWQAFDKLDNFIDVSDPDLDLPNNIHMLQTSEEIRAQGRSDDLVFTGFIHDIGKVLAFYGTEEDGQTMTSQWGLVGDTFVVGAKIPDTVVYPDLNVLNPDMSSDLYSSNLGMYKECCGIDNLLLSYGHDEYMYDMMRFNNIQLSEDCYSIIRYHSFYAWHDKGSYLQFMKTPDYNTREVVRDFNKFDLYTKIDKIPDIDELRPYYDNLIEKYMPGILNW